MVADGSIGLEHGRQLTKPMALHGGKTKGRVKTMLAAHWSSQVTMLQARMQLQLVTTKNTQEDSYADALQKAINLVRKSETTARKAADDRKARVTQWNSWVQHIHKKRETQGSFGAPGTRVRGCPTKTRARQGNVEMETTSEAGLEFDTLLQEAEAREEQARESNAEILRRTLQSPLAAPVPQPSIATPPRVPGDRWDASTPLHVTMEKLEGSGLLLTQRSCVAPTEHASRPWIPT